jgi:hypothetical protein
VSRRREPSPATLAGAVAECAVAAGARGKARRVIAKSGWMLKLANVIEEQLEQHGPDELTVRLSLTDDGFLRSSSWARWPLGIPLPVDG